MKTILLFAFLSVLIATVVSKGGAWGKRKPRDFLLAYEAHTKSAAELQEVTKDVHLNFEKKTITMITALDRQGDGSVTLQSGGVGSSNGVLHLKSGPGKNINVIVEVYGR